MKIQLTIDLPNITPRKRTYTTAQEAVALGIAEGAAQHLLDTFNDDQSLGKITYEVLTIPKSGMDPDLKGRILSELEDWRNECEEILDVVTSTEETLSYTHRLKGIKQVIREVEQS